MQSPCSAQQSEYALSVYSASVLISEVAGLALHKQSPLG